MQNCEGCRYWSEMMAQSIGCGPIEAVCLSLDGPKRGRYVIARTVCEKWAHNGLGAVDSPDFQRSCMDPIKEYRQLDEIDPLFENDFDPNANLAMNDDPGM